jgi:hypothetical protein
LSFALDCHLSWVSTPPLIGPKLEGKIHLYVGEADNYFLNNAVYLVEDFLKTTKNPNYGGQVDYEPRAEPRQVGAGAATTPAPMPSPDSATISSTPPRSSNES